MKNFQYELVRIAHPQTKPEVPWKIRLRAKFFGKQIETEYIWNYYKRESESRIPFYLPYLFMKDIFYYLKRYGQIPKSKISMILVDGGDSRIDYFLYEFLEELNDLTIITDRKEYFENLQERSFQELGLMIDLIYPWQEKRLKGNFVWDFTTHLQKTDCYPKGSICFLPHKKEWKVRELLRDGEDITVFFIENVKIKGGFVSPGLAECILVPKKFMFRKSRCKELSKWCQNEGWQIKLKGRKPEKP